MGMGCKFKVFVQHFHNIYVWVASRWVGGCMVCVNMKARTQLVTLLRIKRYREQYHYYHRHDDDDDDYDYCHHLFINIHSYTYCEVLFVYNLCVLITIIWFICLLLVGWLFSYHAPSLHRFIWQGICLRIKLCR